MIHHYYSRAHRRRIGKVDFLPSDLSDLFWWTRAGFGVTESANDVSEVQDFGSANLPLVQTTGLDQPTLVNNVINGHPVIRYDGVDHNMTAGVAVDWKFLHDGSDYTIYIVFQTTDANPDALLILLNTTLGTSNTGFVCYYDDRSANSRNNRFIHAIYRGVGATFVVNNEGVDDAFPAQTFGIAELVYDRGIAGDDSKIFVDGTAEGSADETDAPNDVNPQGTMTVGQSIADTFHFKGDIAEIIIYKEAQNDTNRTKVRSYLRKKFNTPLS